MIVYEGIKEKFIEEVKLNIIANKIYEQYLNKIGHTTENEIRAWKNSMRFMKDVLEDEKIPNNAGIAIEFKIPNTCMRVDFIISGKDENGNNSVIIIELKQWEKATIVNGKDGIVNTYINKGMRDVSHPSYQAWSYAIHIEDYNETVQNQQIKLHPCAYAHNYEEVIPAVLKSEEFKQYTDKAPIFVSGDVYKLADFIKKYIKYGDNKDSLYMIENGKIRPSKSLQDSLNNMLKGNPEFVLIDEQKVVYETALKMARESYRDGKKRVLIVKGGPGTGKTVVAINLMVKLSNENMVCQYVTKNASLREVFTTKLAGDYPKIKIANMFKGSGSYVESEYNDIDIILADEAHRLTAKSGMFKNKGENQIKEIINASKCAVFFIDEAQRIHIDDIGTIEEISKHLNEANAKFEILELPSQFRCNGSDGYVAWLDNVLQIRETANEDITDIDYDIQIFDNPNKVRDLIFEKNKKNNKARMLAGYCWEWPNDNGRNDPNVCEVNIPEYNFAMSWNLNKDKTFAISKGSVNQIGCIHTSQGLEFDYVGVIIGDDLRYENGKVVTDFSKRAHSDASLKGIKTLYKNNPERALKVADEIIKNTYRTLMTRGQKGCYIYCEDKQLSEYLKSRISRSNEITYYTEELEKTYEFKAAEEGEKYGY